MTSSGRRGNWCYDVDTPVSRAHPAASSCVQLALLATANLLAAVGGGRVTSAAKGVVGLTIFGSGSLLGRIHSGGSGAVALAFGLVVTAATIAPLLMMLGGMQFLGEAIMTVTGLALTAWPVQQVKNLNGWDGSHG
jgi:hypothetical protein